MSLSRTNIVLAVTTIFVALLALNSGVDYSRPNIEILPHMKYSPAYGAYEPNPNFPNGRTLQSPVPGTIARGQIILHYKTTPEDALRAGKEILNPTLHLEEVARQASVKRGGEIFRILCVSCHGPSGKGDGLVPLYGFPPPPSLRTGKSVQMKDGQLLHILTYGQGSMPNFAAQLSYDRRWDVINFIRTLHEQVSNNPEETVKTEEAETKETVDSEEAAKPEETGALDETVSGEIPEQQSNTPNPSPPPQDETEETPNPEQDSQESTQPESSSSVTPPSSTKP